ncbi:MAG: histidine kinase [Alistipes sp.]|nr:histidine kinase [Alistipes sp.]
MNIDWQRILSENTIYAFTWIAVLLVPILNAKLMAEEHININNIIIAWTKIAPFFIIFAIHNSFIAPHLLIKRRYLWYVVCVAMMLGLVFACVDIYQQYIEGRLFTPEDLPEFIPRYNASLTDLQWYWNVLLGLFMLGTNSAIKMLFKSITDERKFELLQNQNLQVEMEYLKYQINPHFFMNTLNNIHALIDIDAEGAKDCVIELSKMMRYVLYESGAHEISLRNELQFVTNYINLMRIRYTDDIEIKFEQPERRTADIFIPPLLFIVFVENAFKHGVSYNRRSYIHIAVVCDNREVRFTVENSRHPRAAGKKKAGIGLENVKKRLGIIYGQNYSLKIDDSSRDSYRVELIIPVSK